MSRRTKDWRPYQRNAADPVQVGRADRRQRDEVAQRRERLIAVLQSTLGRAALWDLITDAGVYGSVMDVSGSQTFYKAGRQDFGHELLARIIDADEHAYLAMEAEARQRQRTADRTSEIEAATGGQDDDSRDRDSREA